MNILFICTGNICRSPMAEGLFRQLTVSRNDLQIGSAGVSAATGQPASLAAVEALQEKGIDLSHHRSRPLDPELAASADLIFTMTRDHARMVTMLYPEISERVFVLRDFDPENQGGESADISDPLGAGLEIYRQCRDQIAAALPGVEKFLEASQKLLHMQTDTTTTTITEAGVALAMGADHGGRELKDQLAAALGEAGYRTDDLGCYSSDSCDYPDFAAKVCAEIRSGKAAFGILVCRSGIGMSISANRFPGVRAALVREELSAELARRHNNANVICLGADFTKPEEAARLVEVFLKTEFEGGRHERRVDKMDHTRFPSEQWTLIEEVDPKVAEAIRKEERRQFENIELIASENFADRAVMEAQGSVLTNKYAEGYPAKRWYGGCENVDVVEQLAIDRAKELFKADHANVQPHSGSQANMAVYFSVLQPGDRILTMDLAHGGHLTHGHPANFSGKLYEVSHYGVSEKDERIDYEALAAQAEKVRPKMITAGASAYPRILDWKRMREIADAVEAYLFVDMAHIAGLVAGGVHPSPVEHAHFVTTTTHKSLRGPRGGLVLCQEEFAKKIDSQLFPGVQGGPLMHVIAAKAVCFQEALQPSFAHYQQQIAANAKALAARLAHNGFRIVSGGTDNHVLLVDLRPHGLQGKTAQEILDEAGITVNKNAIPFDTEPIFKTGGIRIGTPAVTTRGMKEEEMMEIADLITQVLKSPEDSALRQKIRESVLALTSRFPLP